MRRIAAIGMFDGLHAGHMLLLNFLVSQSVLRDLQPAVITFDNHPVELVEPSRAPRLLMTASQKLEAIRKAGISDIILMHFDESLRQLTAADFMQLLHDVYRVDCLIVGYDHRFGHNRSGGFDDYVRIGETIGMQVLRAPEMPGVSSSIVRKLLNDGRVDEAAHLLRRPYFIDGTVVAGRRLGRTIGFPTANLQPLDVRMLVPARGVYVADVSIDGESILRRAILNIGHRPTVDTSPDAQDTIEVHVLDYDADLYGHTMRVCFLCRLRSEQRFPDLVSLKQQLIDDSAAARSYIYTCP